MDVNPQQLQDKARELQARVVPQIEDARRNMTDLNTRALTFIRANPGTALVAAAATGFLIGRIASRL